MKRLGIVLLVALALVAAPLAAGAQAASTLPRIGYLSALPADGDLEEAVPSATLVVALAAGARLPAMYIFRAAVRAGGLMAALGLTIPPSVLAQADEVIE